MRFFATLLLVATVSAGFSQTYKLKVQFNGTEAGTILHEKKPDGSFTSDSQLAIGTAILSSKITGNYEGDKIVRFAVDSRSPAGNATYTYDHGKVVAKSGADTQERTVDFDKAQYFGNLDPQFVATLLKLVDFDKKEAQNFQALYLDAPTVVPVKIKPLDVRETAGKKAKFFNVSLGAVSIDYGMAEDGEVVVMDVPSQKLRMIDPAWEGLYKDPLAAYPELSQPTFKTVINQAIKMQTRDGVELVADVIRPDAPGKFPVILTRTPYGRSTALVEGKFFASRGYVYIAQDCRGRGMSGGDWDPFVHERTDGFDAVEWAGKLPYADGKVGMIGASYGGLVQWAAAVEQPPSLKCLISQVPPPDAFRNIPYDMGVFFLYGDVWWAKIVRNKDADMNGIMGPLPHPEKLTTLPLSKVDDEVLGYNVPLYDKWLERESMNDWGGYDFIKDLDKVNVPALHISGWWDGDLIGTQTIWSSLRKLGRKDQWLIYGPWAHAFNTALPFTDVSYGPTAVIEIDSTYLRWFDTYLKGKDVKQNEVPKVQAFLTGANQWIKSSDWPLAESTTKTYYLSAEGSANATHSNGVLTSENPASQKPSEYTYDPAKDTIPSEILTMDQSKSSTTIDPADFKDNQLTFVTEPLTEPLALGGPITLTLNFTSSARDTDFFATLYDVDEKGVIRVFGKSGKIRASYLGGFDKRILLTPGKNYEAKIQIWDTLHELGKGHRLGVMINSTMFPLFSRNLGTGEPIKDSTKIVIQENRIFHDAAHPSFLTFQELKR